MYSKTKCILLDVVTIKSYLPGWFKNAQIFDYGAFVSFICTPNAS